LSIIPQGWPAKDKLTVWLNLLSGMQVRITGISLGLIFLNFVSLLLHVVSGSKSKNMGIGKFRGWNFEEH
jgi:hypothetical protein